MGTESAELLLQEHALMTQLLQSGERSESALATAQTLLNQRDDYIAQRINETLQDDEMAILFLGLMHNIEAKLPKDIVLIQPLGKPK
jgi:regulator of protease activity HflC (stomatin/prohibitin superfamily)